MTTQPQLEVTSVLKAYAFALHFRGKFSHVTGSIASNVAEALADVKKRHEGLDPEELVLFNNAFAVLEPGIINRYESHKYIEERGLYAFLGGMFFVAYGDQRLVYHCKKAEIGETLIAVIYSGSYHIKPL